MKNPLQNGTVQKALIGIAGACFGAGVTFTSWTGQIKANTIKVENLTVFKEDIQARMIRLEVNVEQLVKGQEKMLVLLNQP